MRREDAPVMGPSRPRYLWSELRQFARYLWQTRLLRAGIYFTIVYAGIVVGGYLVLAARGVLDASIFADDFAVFHTATRVLHENPAELYASAEYDLPYRYLPMFAYLFYGIGTLPLATAYFLNVGFSLACHYATLFLLYVTCKRVYAVDMTTETFEKGFFIALMAPLLVPNLMLGQMNSLLTCLLLAALVCFENHRKHVIPVTRNNLWGGVALGLAATVKPIAILVVPFLLEVTVQVRRRRRRETEVQTGRAREVGGVGPGRETGRGDPAPETGQASEKTNRARVRVHWTATTWRLVGLASVLAPNLLVFLVYPNLAPEFLQANFVHTLDHHHSTSLTRLVFLLFDAAGVPYTPWIVTVSLAIVLYLPPYVAYVRTPKADISLAVYYGYAFLVLLLAYPDAWFLYMLIWYVVQFPAFFQLASYFRGARERRFRWVMIKIGKYASVYFSVGVAIHYLLLGWDPVTPTLLAVYYAGYWRLHRRRRHAVTKGNGWERDRHPHRRGGPHQTRAKTSAKSIW